MKLVAVAFIVILLSSITLTCGFILEKQFGEIRHNDKYDAADVVNKSASDIIRMRGFESEIHYAHTQDGYHLHLDRVINPLISRLELKRPVLFVHGFVEGPPLWVLNSRNARPRPLKHGICSNFTRSQLSTRGPDYLSGPLLLANQGYDVWILSLRGTEWSQAHDHLEPTEPDFWDYSMDEIGLVDIPTAVGYIRNKTGARKVGFVGHSLANFGIFALVSWRPQYAEVIEPIVSIAPIAYFNPIHSILRAVIQWAALPINKSRREPFPRNAQAMRSAMARVCSSKLINMAEIACAFIEHLGVGSGGHLRKGYVHHFPYQSSFKVLRHFGQLMWSRKFAKYDYGKEVNLELYGQKEPPSYPIGNITSKSICLFYTRSDSLSDRAEIKRFMSELRVPLFSENFIDRQYNHFDLITHEDSRGLIFKPLLEIFEHFEHSSGICSPANRKQQFSS